MKANMFVAEHISIHQDGTFTAVRGGIDRFRGEPGEPISLQGQLMIIIRAGRHEDGDHSFGISIVDMDGRKIADDIEGGFSVPEGGGKARFSIGFNFEVEKPGKYEFGLAIDNQAAARATVHAGYKDSDGEDS